MYQATPLRLLPWLSPEGKPCYLAPGGDGGVISRLADRTEARQLAEGLDVCRSAGRVLDDPLTPNAEVRYTAIRLTECLADALRVAESRGRRLPQADDGTDDPGDEPTSEAGNSTGDRDPGARS